MPSLNFKFIASQASSIYLYKNLREKVQSCCTSIYFNQAYMVIIYTLLCWRTFLFFFYIEMQIEIKPLKPILIGNYWEID